MTLTKKREEILAELSHLYTDEVQVCLTCGHRVDHHWWNGAGREENSGYDACTLKECDCPCLSDKTVTKKIINKDVREALDSALTKTLKDYNEAVIRVVEGMRTYRREGGLVVSDDYGEWIHRGDLLNKLTNDTK